MTQSVMVGATARGCTGTARLISTGDEHGCDAAEQGSVIGMKEARNTKVVSKTSGSRRRSRRRLMLSARSVQPGDELFKDQGDDARHQERATTIGQSAWNGRHPFRI